MDIFTGPQCIAGDNFIMLTPSRASPGAAWAEPWARGRDPQTAEDHEVGCSHVIVDLAVYRCSASPKPQPIQL